MGFKLGKLIGNVAGGAIRSVTGGAIRPNFSTASAKPDSTVVTKTVGPGGIISSERSVMYSTPRTNGGAGPGGGCAALWNGSRWQAQRPNKSTYVTRGGGTSRWPKQLVVHPKGTECVTRRRINAGNGKAAIRAVHRLTAFYSLSQRVAKQLRKAASKAHIRGSRGGGRKRLGSGGVSIVQADTD